MQQFIVTGMSCAACQSRVEKAVNAVPGVKSCAVSLLTNSMGVEGTASDDQIISAVVKAGYGASVKGGSQKTSSVSQQEEMLKDRETPVLKRRLIASLGFLIVLMYFSMGHMMWGFPVPAFFEGNHVAMGLLQLLLSTIIMVINQKFFINGFKGLINRSPNMDTLVAMGSAASYIWSVYALFAMTDAVVKGDMDAVMVYMDEFYFESAAMILALITLGKMLEARSKGRTTDAIKSLMKLAPKTAVRVRNGREETVPIDSVVKGDVFVVRPGENIPVDGIVLDGNSAVNEAALTGESIPVDKAPGDPVSAATLNQSGFLRCEATRVGEDTTLAQIIQMVSDAAATKAPIAKIADRVSGVFVPAVITVACITLVIWLLTGAKFGFALARAISVLVISCPCALGLATPVAIMVGNGMGAKNGILFKTAVSLEETGKVDIVALDKTGTITRGEPLVTDLIPADGMTENDLLSLAYSLESRSEHPLARAILKKGQELSLSLQEAENFTALPGNGLSARIAGHMIRGGNLSMITRYASIPDSMLKSAEDLSSDGKTPLFFAADHRFLGIIAVADVVKEDSPEAIAQLRNMGIHVVMLTGDNERTARAIGRTAGVDEVIAGVLPDGKENVIARLKEKGRVAMVGDGINDAPALTRADIGIAIGAGTDVAIDAADVVLMKSRLSDVPAAIRLSRATLTNIHQNLFWAFFYNVICIPLAAGAYIHLFGLKLNPMVGAAAMSLSSFCVVTNALRLNLCKVHSDRKDKNLRKNKPAITPLTLEPSTPMEEPLKECCQPAHELISTCVLEIEGMMCEHCEATVKEVLEALDGVEEALVSHEKGTAVLTLSAPVDESLLRKTVEAEDYMVRSVSKRDRTASEDALSCVMEIEGMMCEHCEATVKEVLEALDGVEKALVSHEKGTAVLTLAAPVSENLLRITVEAEDYTVTAISPVSRV